MYSYVVAGHPNFLSMQNVFLLLGMINWQEVMSTKISVSSSVSLYVGKVYRTACDLRA